MKLWSARQRQNQVNRLLQTNYKQLVEFLRLRLARGKVVKAKKVQKQTLNTLPSSQKIVTKPNNRFRLLPNNSLYQLIHSRLLARNFIRKRLRRTRYRRRRTYGYLNFHRTVHNLFISIHDRKHTLLYSSSICALGSKAKRERFGLMPLRQAGEKLATKLHAFGLHRINIHARCRMNKGLRNLIWSLRYHKVKIYQIYDFIKIPHGFMTLQARRRMKRRKFR